MENSEKPIYPNINSIEANDGQLCAVFTEKGKEGLTKREYFAGLAMQGLISSCDWNVSKLDDSLINATVENAVIISDKLLKQLENE